MKKFKVTIILINNESCKRVYYIKANYAQEAINLCLYDVANKYNIIEVHCSDISERNYSTENMLEIYDIFGTIIKKVNLSDKFYNT